MCLIGLPCLVFARQPIRSKICNRFLIHVFLPLIRSIKSYVCLSVVLSITISLIAEDVIALKAVQLQMKPRLCKLCLIYGWNHSKAKHSCEVRDKSRTWSELLQGFAALWKDVFVICFNLTKLFLASKCSQLRKPRIHSPSAQALALYWASSQKSCA